MSAIRFAAKLSQAGPWTILRLPKNVSQKLPSRGLVLVEGTINDVPLQVALEPDGTGSHWFKVSDALQKATGAQAGELVALAIKPAKKWPEPNVPADLTKALAADAAARGAWQDITPKARWDWIRWINATNNPDTRQKRIMVTCSKFRAGSRRPCCFDRSQCTDPAVSKGGVLIEST